MCRKGKELSLRDRYFIEKSLKRGLSVKEISDVLGVTRACLYYEIRKGTVVQMDTHLRECKVYKADYAQMKTATNVANRGRKVKYGSDSSLLCDICDCLRKKYSPYASIVLCGADGCICEKTIYNYVRSGRLPGVTYLDLPYMKKAKKSNVKPAKIVVPKEYSIENRPKEVSKRDSFGNWEMDTVYSAKDNLSALLVLTERKTRAEMVLSIRRRTSEEVRLALVRIEKRLGTKTFRKVFQTITSDNGVEFKRYEDLERSMYSSHNRTKLYYAHPYCSGERGSNENQNRMIRRWIPKGDDIGMYSRAEIEDICSWMNTYPRKMFNGKSSIEMMMDDLTVGDFSQIEISKILEICNCDYSCFTNLSCE